MIEAAPPPSLSRFSAPADALRGIDAGAAGELIASVADVALVFDGEGVVIDAAFSDPDLAKAAYQDWIGKRWVDTVTAESRVKIEEAEIMLSRHRDGDCQNRTAPDGRAVADSA